MRDAAVDTQIRDRFLPLIEELATRPVEDALASADRALATVIALDQFPRNVFRGAARAFATDALALAVAKAPIARGLDEQVPADRRVLFYLPFEHSEVARRSAAVRRADSFLGRRRSTRAMRSCTTTSSRASAASRIATSYSGAPRRSKKFNF